MKSRRYGASVAAGIAVLLFTAGCEASKEVVQPSDDATVLTVATAAGPDTRASAQIQEFARQVKELSRGSIRVEPVMKAAAEEADGWNQVVAESVEAGDFDMALIPTRTWESQGIASFTALFAPFLVTSDELMRQVISPDIAEGMMAGLKQVGLSGLALFPESPRLLFSFIGPIQTPDDLAGKLVRASRSETTNSVLKSLGANPQALVGDLFSEALNNGTVAAAVTSFGRAESFPKASTTIGNLPIYPKINTLVMNASTLSQLTPNERRVLEAAAAKTRDWAAESTLRTAEDAATYCQHGGTIITATEQEVAAFKAATAPVYAQLEKDPGTKALIAKIRSLAATPTSPASLPACSPLP